MLARCSHSGRCGAKVGQLPLGKLEAMSSLGCDTALQDVLVIALGSGVRRSVPCVWVRSKHVGRSGTTCLPKELLSVELHWLLTSVTEKNSPVNGARSLFLEAPYTKSLTRPAPVFKERITPYELRCSRPDLTADIDAGRCPTWARANDPMDSRPAAVRLCRLRMLHVRVSSWLHFSLRASDRGGICGCLATAVSRGRAARRRVRTCACEHLPQSAPSRASWRPQRSTFS